MKIFHLHFSIDPFFLSSFQGKDYFQRITRLLATYTDLELLASVLGKELDSDVTNRIQLNYVTYLQVKFLIFIGLLTYQNNDSLNNGIVCLQFADETSILDVLMNVKRIIRLHGGILNPLLK